MDVVVYYPHGMVAEVSKHDIHLSRRILCVRFPLLVAVA